LKVGGREEAIEAVGAVAPAPASQKPTAPATIAKRRTSMPSRISGMQSPNTSFRVSIAFPSHCGRRGQPAAALSPAYPVVGVPIPHHRQRTSSSLWGATSG
jgi:hypothetical protein